MGQTFILLPQSLCADCPWEGRDHGLGKGSSVPLWEIPEKADGWGQSAASTLHAAGEQDFHS